MYGTKRIYTHPVIPKHNITRCQFLKAYLSTKNELPYYI